MKARIRPLFILLYPTKSFKINSFHRQEKIIVTTEVWDPNNTSNTPNDAIDIAFLKAIVQRMQQGDGDKVEGLLSQQEATEHRPMMTADKVSWQQTISVFEQQELLILMRFFTLAEVTYEGWTADEKSPVIYLAKALRQQGYHLDKELLMWIKVNNPNKFLPFGPLM